MGREGKLWIRVFPHKPVTGKPAEVRMGSGKGEPVYWAAVIKPGTVLYEIGGLPEEIARSRAQPRRAQAADPRAAGQAEGHQ